MERKDPVGRPGGKRTPRPIRMVQKGLRCLRKGGVAYTWKKVERKLFSRRVYARLLREMYTEEELETQRSARFDREVKISILVPLFNTPERFLREMLQSVLEQTYAGWELCLADGSGADHGEVERICREYAEKDGRIKYRRLEQNLGISGNTNACIEMAAGEYIALFDHDDLLHPAALYEVMKAICEQDADFIYTDEAVFEKDISRIKIVQLKPEYAPDTLRGCNYICHLTVFSRPLLDRVGGGFHSEYDGSQDYDMVLRLTEKAERIVHIPKPLYYWRSSPASVASDISAKPYTVDAAKRCLKAHLERCGLDGEVEDSAELSAYRIQYKLTGSPLVSILIPNKDHIEDLRTCIRSIVEKTAYPNWEIIVIENNSEREDTFAYYRELTRDERVRVVTYDGGFNFSRINNFGAGAAKGEYLLLLNNDTEVISPDWLEQMLMYAQRPDVGAVGAMLYYADQTVQHGGVILGIGGFAGHSHKGAWREDIGYMFRLCTAQNLSAVTGACMMVRRAVWDEANGLDESFAVALNDVDFCLRLRAAGYLVVWTPFAELYHYESKSRGYEDTPEKKRRFQDETARFRARWKKELDAGDPYYNPNLTLDGEDFSIK